MLYHDTIRRQQLDIAAKLGSHPPHKVRRILDSSEFKRITRASLYVGMSDGARIDFIRRHNLDIGNEQVLPYYETSAEKVNELLRDLRAAQSDTRSTFQCLFLFDDFCGSGRTLLREAIVSKLDNGCAPPSIPQPWRSRLRFNQETNEIELRYDGELSTPDQDALLKMGEGEQYISAVNTLVKKSKTRETVLKGALSKAAAGVLADALDPNAAVFFCPLLATDHALSRLRPLLPKLRGPFSRTLILPGAVLDARIEITSASPMGALCEKYYSDDFGDRHTGCVKYGYDNCGLPLVLHHNTPNNSIYLLWARKRADFTPLFVRYERHGRERA